jgi:hypothetical protein
MSDEQKDSPQCSGKLFGTAFKIENSDYYKLHLLEHEAVMDNKYFLSKTVGYEVSYEQALWNFDFCHRDKWIKSLRESGLL